MRLVFEELSLRAGDVGYGFFSGEAELDSFGEPVSFEIDPTAKGKGNLKLDIAALMRERVALRRKLGVGFLEDEGPEVVDHLKKWVLFQALSESVRVQYKEEIGDYLLDLWSPYAEPVPRRSQRFL
jgi:hypothetical protein